MMEQSPSPERTTEAVLLASQVAEVFETHANIAGIYPSFEPGIPSQVGMRGTIGDRVRNSYNGVDLTLTQLQTRQGRNITVLQIHTDTKETTVRIKIENGVPTYANGKPLTDYELQNLRFYLANTEWDEEKSKAWMSPQKFNL
jgi:hypothetical protein